ncbi:MAG: type 1 glutamine amidotransferase, partial [Desulfobacterales bacterium]|nr:type 1 glutamine amidotransferase [Desulfobacterales bacterium]
IPDKAIPLFSSQHCKNQAYTFGDNVLAMQCHVEMTEPLMVSWTDGWKDDLTVSTSSQQSYEEIRFDLSKKIKSLNQVAENIYSRWISKLRV